MAEVNPSNKDAQPSTVDASFQVNSGPPTVSITVEVTPADGIEVEESDTLKYLRLRAGDFALAKRVFLIVDGERVEITVAEFPLEP
ncbi:MAG: hypothetical protein F4W95_05360 [Chloroflexi bacterium]|nr:hypothetical protein [Chloroflexota bacterium]MYD47895.1 hypothetical protein [Chloroflexota bacterium]